jgi:hypothetical protein
MVEIYVHFFNQPFCTDDINQLDARDTFTLQRLCFNADDDNDRSSVVAEGIICLADKYQKVVDDIIKNPAPCSFTDQKFVASNDGSIINIFVCFAEFYSIISVDINAAKLIADIYAAQLIADSNAAQLIADLQAGSLLKVYTISYYY